MSDLIQRLRERLLERLRALAPSREQIEANPWLRGLGHDLANPKLWHWSRRGVAAGAAIGLFIGFLIPIAQIVLAVVAAVFIRANVPVAAAGTLVTNPLTVPPIYFAAYHLGIWASGRRAPPQQQRSRWPIPPVSGYTSGRSAYLCSPVLR